MYHAAMNGDGSATVFDDKVLMLIQSGRMGIMPAIRWLIDHCISDPAGAGAGRPNAGPGELREQEGGTAAAAGGTEPPQPTAAPPPPPGAQSQTPPPPPPGPADGLWTGWRPSESSHASTAGPAPPAPPWTAGESSKYLLQIRGFSNCLETWGPSPR